MSGNLEDERMKFYFEGSARGVKVLPLSFTKNEASNQSHVTSHPMGEHTDYKTVRPVATTFRFESTELDKIDGSGVSNVFVGWVSYK